VVPPAAGGLRPLGPVLPPLLPIPLVGSLVAVYRPLLLPESVESHPDRYARQNRQSRSARGGDCIVGRLQGYAAAQECGFS
jgi:hypothetical protein